MSFLLDTNVISELRKGARCDPHVAAWFAATPSADLFLSVIVLGEVRKGVEQLRRRDPAAALSVERWLVHVETLFGSRILGIDRDVADAWGRMSALRAASPIDALLAATAKVHGLTLVTRNTAQVTGLGATVLNPFKPPA